MSTTENFATLEEGQRALLHSAFSALLRYEGNTNDLAELQVIAHLLRYSVILKRLHPLTFGMYLGYYTTPDLTTLNAAEFDQEKEQLGHYSLNCEHLLIFGHISNPATRALLVSWSESLRLGQPLAEEDKAALILGGDISLDQRLSLMQLSDLPPT